MPCRLISVPCQQRFARTTSKPSATFPRGSGWYAGAMVAELRAVIDSLLHDQLWERCRVAGCPCWCELGRDCPTLGLLWRSEQDIKAPVVVFFHGEGEAVREFTYVEVVEMQPVLAWADQVHEYQRLDT